MFTPKGELKTRIGRQGNGPGEFSDTYLGSLSFDAKGVLYVRHEATLERFDQNGRYLGALAIGTECKAGDFAFAPDGDLWVFCTNSQRAQKLALAESLRP